MVHALSYKMVIVAKDGELKKFEFVAFGFPAMYVKKMRPLIFYVK
jgi:hypothetical protein